MDLSNSNLHSTTNSDSATHGLTVFDNELPNSVAGPTDVAYMPPTLVDTASEAYKQGIIEFLARPISYSSFSFGTTSTDPLYKVDLNRSFLYSKQVWADKLRGFRFIRGTVVLRLQVNANPFQQGRLIMYYEPAVRDSKPAFSRPDLAHATVLPNVQLDICCHSEATLRVPWVHVVSHLDIGDADYCWGLLKVRTYLPFATGTGGATSCGCVLWASLEDVELSGPVPPSKYPVPAPTGLKTQSGVRTRTVRRKFKNPEQSEQGGIISNMLSKTAQVAEALSGVPFLSSIAMPVSWISQAGASIAASFGWAKPLSETPNMRMNSTFHHESQLADGVDNAMNMGLFHDTRTPVAPYLGGVDVDEMCFDYVKEQYAFSSKFNWSATDTAGKVLLDINLAPGNFVGGGTSFSVLPIAHLASFFELWRGGFKFRLKLAKTPYHSGRLSVTYGPYNSSVESADAEYVHRDILDVRDGNEFEFIVPYMNPQAFIPYASSSGRFGISVLAPLQAPTTASQTITIAVEVCGAPDFECAVPCSPRYMPYFQATDKPLDRERYLRDERVYVHDVDYELVTQGADVVECRSLSKPVGRTVVSSLTSEYAAASIGEQVRSFKQLLTRTCYSTNGAPDKTVASCFSPFILSGWTGTPVASTYPLFFDYVSSISCCYAYSRGGMILRVLPTDAMTSDARRNVVLSLVGIPATADSITVPGIASLAQGDSAIVENLNAVTLSAYIPQYGMSYGRINAPADTKFRWGQPWTSAAYVSLRSGIALKATSIIGRESVILGRAMADDGQLSFYLGPPLMTLSPDG